MKWLAGGGLRASSRFACKPAAYAAGRDVPPAGLKSSRDGDTARGWQATGRSGALHIGLKAVALLVNRRLTRPARMAARWAKDQ